MPPRTYIPGLREVAADYKRYFERWSVKLDANLTDPQYAAALAANTQINTLLVALGEIEIVP
jgi:hypothetical protein